MNYLEKLLQGVKVEWKTLGDVAELYSGLRGKSKSDFTDGNVKYIPYLNIFKNIEVDFESLELVKVLPGENQSEVKYGDVLFTASSEIAEEAGMSASVTTKSNEKVYLNSFCFGIRFNHEIKLTPEFTKYLFRSNFMRKEIAKTANGVTRYNISKNNFKKILIPIPPLSIQEEIVQILDKYTESIEKLTAELNAELIAREKQYDYYREEFLSFKDNKVEWKTLEDVFDMRAGKHIPASKISPFMSKTSPYPCFGGNGIRGFVNNFSHKGAFLFIGRQGALCGNVKRFIGKFYATEHAVVVKPSDAVNIDFAFHLLTFMNLNQYASKSAQPGLAVGNLKKLRFPVPPLAEQERIVGILDKFDTLTRSISEGLPREIELRQKQYEYYRDKLLMFNE